MKENKRFYACVTGATRRVNGEFSAYQETLAEVWADTRWEAIFALCATYEHSHVGRWNPLLIDWTGSTEDGSWTYEWPDFTQSDGFTFPDEFIIFKVMPSR